MRPPVTYKSINNYYSFAHNMCKEDKFMVIANIIAYLLTIIGGLNWGLVGIFNFNLVDWIGGGYRSWFSILVYVLVLISAIWLIISPFISKGKLRLKSDK